MWSPKWQIFRTSGRRAKYRSKIEPPWQISIYVGVVCVTDWAEILQKHIYGQSSSTGKRGSAVVIFRWIIWVKLLKNAFHRTKDTLFRNISMDWLQGQLKFVYDAVIFHCVILVKLLKNAFRRTKHSEKSPIGLMFCRNIDVDCLQGQLKLVRANGHFSFRHLSKITQKMHSIGPNILKKSSIGLIFCRTIPVEMATGIVKNGSGADIFHWVNWIKVHVLKNALR